MNCWGTSKLGVVWEGDAVMAEKYIQIGVTALRDPATGGFLPAVPLYIKADEAAEEAERQMIADLAKVLARKMKTYIDGCNRNLPSDKG